MCPVLESVNTETISECDCVCPFILCVDLEQERVPQVSNLAEDVAILLMLLARLLWTPAEVHWFMSCKSTKNSCMPPHGLSSCCAHVIFIPLSPSLQASAFSPGESVNTYLMSPQKVSFVLLSYRCDIVSR